ncbi:LysR family transcriptional regulator substrate-binding protein [Roseovarius sp. MBR-6]|jgi:DNA-binding transcriptional LysR family regulator|uniref:LysR family transcriptional regulator substrate-binding protein n=1 Tax=Roseovarius sp. MBR-6 TaxID=3156459 RepID=UPI00339B7FFF
MLVCAKGARFAGRESVGWDELAGERLCLLAPDMQNRRIINRNFAAVEVTPDVWIDSNSTAVLMATVEAGGWMTVLPEDTARFHAAGNRCEIDITYQSTKYRY